jgi:FKBP-type peptidyl-prolyl cis-trans isomerase FklB
MNFKKIVSGFAIVIAAALVFTACDQKGASSSSKDVVIVSEIDSVSYAIGVDVASSIKEMGFKEINSDAVGKAFNDVFNDVPVLISRENAQPIIRAYIDKVRAEKAKEAEKEANDFLEKNAKNEGVQTTESGLQYKIIKEGSGAIPKVTDKVKVYYTGTLVDGTKFDGTTEGNPASFNANGVIKGWTEALTMMPVGSKWQLFIPPGLAYGANPPRGSNIPPNSVLVFDIELLDIVPKK